MWKLDLVLRLGPLEMGVSIIYICLGYVLFSLAGETVWGVDMEGEVPTDLLVLCSQVITRLVKWVDCRYYI